MDLDGLREVLQGVESGSIRTVAIDTPEPSPFCHEILNANPYAYLDDAPLEERRARAVQLRRTLRDDVDGAGVLDPAAIAEVAAESWPLVRDADELHDALMSLVVLHPVAAWSGWFDELVADRRAAIVASFGSAPNDMWTCTERADVAAAAYGSSGGSRDEAVAEVLRGWLECSGPLSAAAIGARLKIEDEAIEAALLRLETQGQVLRGRFTGPDAGAQWCNRRVLARIHRRTIGTLRREIEPVTTAAYVTFLQRWQHVAAASRLHGIDGTLQIVRQLEGYEIPAYAWEQQILPARVAGYRPELLDRLCYAGDVMWGRLSPHPALEANLGDDHTRVRPTRLAPIALFLRANAEQLIVQRDIDCAALSHAAREILDRIEILHAPFFAEIARATKRLPSEVEEALWQLVAAGLVTADGFDALRSLSDAKRRLGEKGLRARPRSSSGRWTLLSAATPRIDREAFARRLLARWGVVFRDVIARESLAPPWRELLAALRRMEARGEIRGGRFVAGFVGEQFALPEAVDALRAARRSGADGERVSLGAYDPLNLTGIILPVAVA
jgi:ATP-dependent Lhr-like helicase